jgi:hypothetical protein
MTALRMAQGIADKMGVSFGVIDTEARSASKYADRIPFDVDDLNGKTVDHYLAAMDNAAKAGYKMLVIDSLSHAWRELTEEVDRIAQSSTSKNTFSAWGKVAPKQKRLVDAILNYPGHLITTMRSKTEWVVGEGKSGKLAPEKMGLAPEQGKGIEYEFDLLIEMNQAHQATVTKDRTGKFQDEVIEKPGEEFGVALYDWLSSGSAIAPAVATPTATTAPVVPAKPQSTTASATVTKAAIAPATTTGPAKPKANDKGGKAVNPLKATVDKIIDEIGDIVKAELRPGAPGFTEGEKNEVREVVKATQIDAKGIEELNGLKDYLNELLTERKGMTEVKKAA